jgi:hypothetical protein
MKKVYYYQPCPDFPAGGPRISYRHVDVLNQNGIPAAILHPKSGYRYPFASTNTKIEYVKDLDEKNIRVLVLPEFHGYSLNEGILTNEADYLGSKLLSRFNKTKSLAETKFHLPKCPKIILNQNSYYTFQNYPLNESIKQTIYTHPDTLGIFCVSEDNQNYLKLAFPDRPIHRIVYSHDFEIFKFSESKKLQCAYMPRKNIRDIEQVLSIIKLRGNLNDFKFIPVDQLPTSRVSEILKESQFFLSFGDPEGCPMPPVEAMLSGCTVIGYHGRGGTEYWKPEFSFPIERGDIITFVKAIEECAVILRKSPEELKRRARAADSFIREKYSAVKEKESILSGFSAFGISA